MSKTGLRRSRGKEREKERRRKREKGRDKEEMGETLWSRGKGKRKQSKKNYRQRGI
jgi:hypothetical protein